MFRNIIFDFDGTIVDSKMDIANAQLWVLRRLRVDWYTAEDLYPHVGKTLEETFKAVLPAEMRGKIPEAAVLYSEYYPPRSLLTTSLFPGVQETLERLYRGGKRLAVASTKRGRGVRRATDHFGITHMFIQLQGSDDVPCKPDPAILRKIIEEQHWVPADTLMVGDTDNDILAGRNAGLATCAVTYGTQTESQLLEFGPEYVIRRFPELLSIVGDQSRAP